MAQLFNQIDKLLFKEYQETLLENPQKYFTVDGIIESIKHYEHHNDLYDYVLAQLSDAFLKIKLETVLKRAGFAFCNFIDEKKWDEWRKSWGSSQEAIAERMLMDKKVMALVIETCNEIIKKANIYLVKNYPENQLWTDSFGLVDSLDVDNTELVEVYKDCDADRLKILSRYIDWIEVK